MTWKILSILAMVLPVCAVVLGLLCWRYPPAGPTWAYGFRSRRARAGDAAWAFAQEWAGKSWFLGGLAMLLVTLLVCGKQQEAGVETMAPAYLRLIVVQIVLLLALVVTMNVLLLVKFDRFGRRKSRDKSWPGGKKRAEDTGEDGYAPEEDTPEDYDPYDESREDDSYEDDSYEDDPYGPQEDYDPEQEPYDDGWEDFPEEPEE